MYCSLCTLLDGSSCNQGGLRQNLRLNLIYEKGYGTSADQHKLQILEVDFFLLPESFEKLLWGAMKVLNESGIDGLELGLELSVFFKCNDVVGDDCV